VFLFSGGKDATIGLDFLIKYLTRQVVPIHLDVVLVTYPKHVYYLEDGTASQCYIDVINYWKNRAINLITYNPDEEDFSDDEITACGVCKRVRKSCIDPYLEKSLREKAGKVVGVITGYTLYDALAYMDEILLVTNFMNNNFLESDIKIKNRVMNCLHKMKAREELPNGLTVIRPLINMHENQVIDYVETMEIPYINRACKAAKSKHKRKYFTALDVAAPINHTDYKSLLQFIKRLDIEFPTTFEDILLSNYFTDC
jgi:tRNA(Ile)-lysidine synthase TilS/MesJ